MTDRQIRQARGGDADAFAALCAPLEGMVYRHCLLMLGNPADAQDAAQEAMLCAFRAMPRFMGASSVSTWLFRIAHNVCLDWLKRPQTRRAALSLNAMAEAGQEPPDPREEPESRYLRQSEQELLREALNHLSPENQALLTLRYGDQLSYEDLAGILSIPEGTVKSRLNRAKEKLRAFLPKS